MKQFANLMVLVFVISSLSGIGLTLTMSEVLAPLRRVWLVLAALVCNFVVVPAVAVAVAKMLSLPEPQAVGLILLGAAAGAPFLPKLIERAKGDVGLSVSLMVLLMVSSLVYLPLVLPYLLPNVSVDSLKIAQKLFLTMILPLGIGLVVKSRNGSLAGRLSPWLDRLSSISLILALGVIVAIQSQRLLALASTRAIPAIVLFEAISLVVGYVLGGRATKDRQVVAFATASRNIPAALIIGSQNFADPNVVLMVIVVALVNVVLFIPLTIVVRRQRLSACPPERN